jgi:exodeoxyribonuclease VII small subunit
MPKADQPAPPRDFETALRELERLVRDLEQGELTLEQSLAAYKRGMELSAFCQQTLEAAEQQVKILEDGVLQPFQAETRGGDD